MGSIATTIFGWTVAVVAVVALVAGPSSAASIASNAMQTIGITAGAIVGGVDSLVQGFRAADGNTHGGIFGSSTTAHPNHHAQKASAPKH